MSTLFVNLVGVCVFALLLCITLIHLWDEISSNAPFIPISKNMRKEIISVLQLDEKSVCYDLGSGDGRVVVALARAYPSSRIIGVERSRIPYFISRYSLWRAKAKNATVLNRDFFKHDLSDATHLFLFLHTSVMGDLKQKLEKELAPGTKVVSCDFTFPDKEPTEVHDFSKTQWGRYKLYEYTF